MKNIFLNSREKPNLVVGAGLCGAVIAERIANVLNEKVLIIDKNSYVGGLCCDYKNRSSVLVNKFGIHVFHTSNKPVWNYINSFGEFNTFFHKVFAYIDGELVNLPLNISSLRVIFFFFLAKRLEYKLLNLFSYNSDVSVNFLRTAGDSDLDFLADFILNKLSKPYAEKLFPNALQKDFPYDFIRISMDCRYYSEKFQGVPKLGYTSLIENMLRSPNIELSLNTDYNYMISKNFKRIFFTGSIDDCFNYKYGMLKYKSVEMKIIGNAEFFAQDCSVVKYPEDFDFSAIHKFKGNAGSIFAKEYWSDYVYGGNARAYPLCDGENFNLYKQYKKYSKIFPDLYFLGRQGSFKPYSMSEVIEEALRLFDNLPFSADKSIDGVVDNCR